MRASRREGAEKNAWQVSAAIDRLILLGLLLTSALGIAAAFGHAAGRASSAWSADRAGRQRVTALLIVYRMLQEPGLDEATVVKAGAPLALVVLGRRRAGPGDRRCEEEDADEAGPEAV